MDTQALSTWLDPRRRRLWAPRTAEEAVYERLMTGLAV